MKETDVASDYELFFSYSTKDQEAAFQIVDHLESRDVKCWIAPRDIPTAQSWAGAIIEGLNRCPFFLILLTEHSNASKQVLREVERAIDKGMTVIPVILSDVEQSADLQYYLSTIQWLDAREDSLESCAEQIVEIVRDDTASNNEPVSRDSNASQGTFSEEMKLHSIIQQTNSRPWHAKLAIGVAFTLLGISLTSIFMAYHKSVATDIWMARFNELKGTIFEGLGFEIGCARSLVYIPCIAFVLLSRFRNEMGQLFNFRSRIKRVWALRLTLCLLSIAFGAYESYRHLSPNEAPRKLVIESGVEEPSPELVELQRPPYAAFLPYSLVNYMIIVPLLIVIPIAAATTDFPKVQSQSGWVVGKMSNGKWNNSQIISSFRKFESNCQAVCEKYLSLSVVLLVAINYECWVGRFTLSATGFSLMTKGWIICGIVGAGSFLWMFGIYVKANQAAANSLVSNNSNQSVSFRNEHNGMTFSKWLLFGTPTGMAFTALLLLLVFWSFRS